MKLSKVFCLRQVAENGWKITKKGGKTTKKKPKGNDVEKRLEMNELDKE